MKHEYETIEKLATFSKQTVSPKRPISDQPQLAIPSRSENCLKRLTNGLCRKPVPTPYHVLVEKRRGFDLIIAGALDSV